MRMKCDHRSSRRRRVRRRWPRGCQDDQQKTPEAGGRRAVERRRAPACWSAWRRTSTRPATSTRAARRVDDALKLDPENAAAARPVGQARDRAGPARAGRQGARRSPASSTRRTPRRTTSAASSASAGRSRRQAFEFYTAAAEKAPAELAYLMAKAEMLVAMDRSDEALALLQDKVVYFEHSAGIRDAVGQLLMQPRAVRAKRSTCSARRASSRRGRLPIREHLALALFYDKQYREAADVLGKLREGRAVRQARRPARWRWASASCRSASRATPAQLRNRRAARPVNAGVWLGLARPRWSSSDLQARRAGARRSRRARRRRRRGAPAARLPPARQDKLQRRAGGVPEGQRARPQGHRQPLHGRLRPREARASSDAGHAVLRQGAEAQAERRAGDAAHGGGRSERLSG